MKTLWKGHANPRVGLGMILAAVCAALLFTACPLFESPEPEIPDLSGYWFAENVSVMIESEQVSVKGLAIIQNGSIEFLAFELDGDHIAGMRGTYSNTDEEMTVQVNANFDPNSANWSAETSTEHIPFTLVNNVLTMDIPGPNDNTMRGSFTKIAAPSRPAAWVGNWSGTWAAKPGAAAILQADGSFEFSFNGTMNSSSIYLIQTGVWQLIVYGDTNYLLNHITHQTINTESADVDFYGLTVASLNTEQTQATIETSLGLLVLDKQQ
ncbi:hypothetical protein [Gracilinema caldarium]|uniref:hypothetical protein n=1 Tax=Gracilinema caldarium TaxID=215591 RepID=UPI0026EADAAE|nr:hypothetical protein [Gracilinema caldarium]